MIVTEAAGGASGRHVSHNERLALQALLRHLFARAAADAVFFAPVVAARGSEQL